MVRFELTARDKRRNNPQGESVNTKFSYMYRDGGNNKRVGSLTFAGPPSQDLEKRLRQAFDECEYFIAHQIGIPEIFLWNPQMDYDPDDPTTYPENMGRDGYCIAEDLDHCWHELDGIQATMEPANDAHQRTIEQFLFEVERIAKHGWQDFKPVSRTSTVAGPRTSWLDPKEQTQG
jgi:hypothetical protein